MTNTTEKKIYAVYHSTNPMNMVFPEMSKVDWLLSREATFLHVATVQASLESVFERTNEHGNGAWNDNQEVIWHSEGPLRSTSVGDVIYEEETHRVWVVAVAGLEEFTPPPLLPLHE